MQTLEIKERSAYQGTYGTLICDLQYGHAGVGLAAVHQTEESEYPVVVCAHCPANPRKVIGPDGRVYVHRYLPSAIFHPSLKSIMIGPGATIDPEALEKELANARAYGFLLKTSILIHGQAVVITDEMREAEKEIPWHALPSGIQGEMVAQGRKLSRDTVRPPTAWSLYMPQTRNIYIITHEEYQSRLMGVGDFLAEGFLGYSEGIHLDHYPHVTHRDCSAAGQLSALGIPLSVGLFFVGVMSLFPARVVPPSQGNYPLHPDQWEMSWQKLGTTPEELYLPDDARVFSYSEKQIEQALQDYNGAIFLNHAHLIPEQYLKGKILEIAESLSDSGSQLSWLSYGLRSGDIEAYNERNNTKA